MRLLARIGFTLAGLALAAPAIAQAGMPIPSPGPYNAGKPKKTRLATAPKRLCAECQRKKIMVETGVDVPPAPPLPVGQRVPNEVCAACGSATAVLVSGKLVMSPVPVMLAGGGMPGRAVVGGENEAAYASVGNEPAPVGVMEPRYAWAQPGAGGAMPGKRDDSVAQTSAIASNPVANRPAGRPHILSHLIGVSGIGREGREMRARRQEDAHASITYGAVDTTITDVPASVVYGRRR